MKVLRVVASLAGLVAVPSVANAQVVQAGQGVADRSRPGYDAIGSNLGGFRAYPSITTDVQATDNYLASSTNRRGDVWLSFHPDINLRSQWSRHRLDARLFLDQAVHANLSSENATQFGGALTGAYDISRDSQLHADLSAGRFVESRSSLGSVQNASEPVKYTAVHGGVGIAQLFGDVTANADASLDYRNFSDTRIGTFVLDQDFRDVRSVGFGGSVQYSLRNGIGLIVSSRYSDDRYTFRPGAPGFVTGTDLNRNSSGVSVQGGITLELTRLVYGSLQVGYLTRRYSDSRLTNFNGLSFNGSVLWNVTALTTLRFTASRSIEDTSSPQVAGNIRNDFHAYVDHELYRNIILSGDIGYGRFRPNGIGVGGNEFTIGSGARYLIDRRFSITGAVRYSQRSSDSLALRYSAVSASVGLRVQF